MSKADSKSEAAFAAIIQKLQSLSPVRIWLLAIFISVVITEIIVCAMELLLKGQITYDYLLTGLVASISVAGIVAALLITLLGRLRQEAKTNEWIRDDLKDSEERYRLAITASNSAMWDYDLKTGRVFLSDNWSKFLTGVEKPTYTTIQDLTALVPKDEQQVVRDAILSVVKSQAASAYRITHRVRKPDGNFILISSEGRVTKRDRDGRALHMIGINRDITNNRLN
ncbi:MAG TPA: PAS domain-containing protein [Gallionella sp.]|nr:PAS domain-containing protein [Gallionella sp.]